MFTYLSMETFEAIRRRKSVRKYQQKPIEKEKLLKILEAARLAPSAKNLQPWHFVVVTDQKVREEIARGTIYARFIKDAPVLIVGCGDPRSKFYQIDVAIALQNLVLAATDLGFGTCWIGDFREEKVKRLLGIPDRLRVVALVTVGYEKEGLDISRKVLHTFRKRKPLEEIVHWERF